MDDPRPLGLRERTRRIAQAELTVVAQDLFLARGYEATTVDQIAAAAGMSKRTFFRYFVSKDDLVIGKYDRFGDMMADALAARPDNEPIWESLRRVFDIAVEYVEDPQQRARNDAMERIMQSTPALTAGYLGKLSRMQTLLTDGVRTRLGAPMRSPDPRPATIVGAAFACLVAAQTTWLASDQKRSFAEVLDESMGVLNVN